MDEFAAHFRTEPGHAAPSAVRLRRMLKAALRVYGFRCLAVRPPAAPEPKSTPVQQAKPARPAGERRAS